MTKYMMIMRATDDAVEAFQDMPFDEVIAAMGRYNEEMMKAGIMLAGEGLSDASEGFVVDFTAEAPLVTDGPYGETKELFNGFWIIDVASKEEAVEWARRCPLGPGSKLEVRRVNDIEDFPQDNEWIRKEVGWRAEQAERLAADARRGAAQA
ncbi:YciI family protein [Agromyces bracchium]|uniref:YciI family protein n=1 Tax=Agromyces bracchium TaxID=88376 RepID=A0A6I3LYF6_9MICO|nr:YciI family protein [Agromyces bracchium]MTH67570.1 YciI family protein [Agromyces bracchium]